MNDDVNDLPDSEKAKQLPEPSGYKLLCALPEVEDKYESGILKADTTVRVEEHSTVVLFVLKVGPQAYADMDKFPNGPWCKEGDFVITRAYAGTRFKIHGREFRLINDDQVEAVVQDPRGITRA
jgi:co-chaperonin GroES (HSP10)